MMEDLACDWSPRLIVELIKSIAWPVVVLLIGFSCRARIIEVSRSFFSKNIVSEISATTSGVSAKFVTAKQSTGTLEAAGSNAANLPRNMSFEAINERHEQLKTEWSEEIYRTIIEHANSLGVDNDAKVNLLSRELSILQCIMRYFDINKVLFRSQYDLFSVIASNGGCISEGDARLHFEKIRECSSEAFADWDWIKYIAYPVSNHLIYESDNYYKLTSIGSSYVAFMSKSPQLVDELAKL